MKGTCSVRYRAKGIMDTYAMPHAHDNEFEIFQPLDNSGSVIIKNKIYPMKKGALYFIDGINSHCPSPSDAGSYRRNIIIISRSYCAKLFEMLNISSAAEKLFSEDGGSCCPLSEKDAETANGIFERMSKISCESDAFSEVKLVYGMAALMELGLRNKNTRLTETNDIVSKILNYTEENLGEGITLDKICTEFHISKYYLCHLFKKQTGLTVTEYIHMRRIAVAKTLLCSTEKTVGEVAAECGFNSQAYFGKLFSLSEGVTPGEFRRKNKLFFD